MAVGKGKSFSRRSLAAAIEPRLKPASASRTRARLAELAQAAKDVGAGKALAALLGRKKKLGSFLAAVMDCSPFLRSLMVNNPVRLVAILKDHPGVRRERIVTATAKSWVNKAEPKFATSLRRARAEMALLSGLADLGGVWDVVAVTTFLTEFADAVVGAAVRFVLREAVSAGLLSVRNVAKPEEGSGWIILGMGKLGAGELNYSSDIDLIVFYDPEAAKLPSETEPSILFVRLTKKLVTLLQERTTEGYVFRTDLRLRPDPGATNIAISTDAALHYYESLGQNWERAALIKARPVAGDKTSAEKFLRALTPFIWRKYLDYAAIADIHSIKRQIHDHRGHDEIAVRGHNIKLGRGGIREIEFFVQTQQLIAGGRNSDLRGNRTLETLAALAEGGWIDRKTCDDLTAAYLTLRRIEHCLQMIADEQTHTLPDDEVGLAVVADMAGYKSATTFSKALLATLETVRRHYGALFETAPALGAQSGSLVFTGDTDDPGTLETLVALGYANPTDVSRTVRGWHFGRYPAMRSAMARERLTEITPTLLETFAATGNANATFAAFDRFLARLPGGVQLFSLLSSNRGLLDLLATIMSAAPRLAETIIQRAHVLDALIEPTFFGRLPERATVERRLAASLREARNYEDVLDRARIFGQEQKFLVGVRVLAGTIDPRRAGRAYADLAEVLLAALTEAVEREFERIHGRMNGGAIAVLALGKLGGREMTAASDLDLILLYDFDKEAVASKGNRPLAGAQYYARLTQRLVAALSSPTGEGKLYDVDFRLRPSGRSGPLASHIDGFVAYQANKAWTWEHMALTRARAVAGDKRLIARAEKEIAAIIRRKRDGVKLAADVLEMRGMVEEAKGGEGAWDLKQAAGGLVDIEFIAQYLQLAEGFDHRELISTETEIVLVPSAKAGVLPPSEADILVPAMRLYQSLIQILRLCVEGVFRPDDAPRGLLERLTSAADLPDFASLDRHLRDTQDAVRGAFERLIGKVPVAEKRRIGN